MEDSATERAYLTVIDDTRVPDYTALTDNTGAPEYAILTDNTRVPDYLAVINDTRVPDYVFIVDYTGAPVNDTAHDPAYHEPVNDTSESVHANVYVLMLTSNK